MRNPNTTVRVQGGLRSDRPTVNLRVTDGSSGTILLEIEFTAAEWLALSGGTILSVPAWITPDIDRVGKQMHHRTLDVPREIFGGVAYRDYEDVARAWGRKQAGAGEHVETRNTNSGWKIVLRRYEP